MFLAPPAQFPWSVRCVQQSGGSFGRQGLQAHVIEPGMCLALDILWPVCVLRDIWCACSRGRNWRPMSMFAYVCASLAASFHSTLLVLLLIVYISLGHVPLWACRSLCVSFLLFHGAGPFGAVPQGSVVQHRPLAACEAPSPHGLCTHQQQRIMLLATTTFGVLLARQKARCCQQQLCCIALLLEDT